MRRSRDLKDVPELPAGSVSRWIGLDREGHRFFSYREVPFEGGGWERVKGFLLEKPCTLELAVEEVANAVWRRVTLLRDVSVEEAFTILNDLTRIEEVSTRGRAARAPPGSST